MNNIQKKFLLEGYDFESYQISKKYTLYCNAKNYLINYSKNQIVYNILNMQHLCLYNCDISSLDFLKEIDISNIETLDLESNPYPISELEIFFTLEFPKLSSLYLRQGYSESVEYKKTREALRKKLNYLIL